ncbi:hypothetical protein ES703_27614 [subsurface metagenome]
MLKPSTSNRLAHRATTCQMGRRRRPEVTPDGVAQRRTAPPLSLSIKLYPAVCIAALKEKIDKPLCLWYELRALNKSGCGGIYTDDIWVALVPELYSRATLFRILVAGEGIFWDIPQKERSKLRLRGLESVSRYFSIPLINRPVVVPDGQWPRSRKGKRAWIYGSFHGSNGKANPKPISRQSIQETTSVLRRQQIRYEKEIKVRRTPNFVVRQVGDRMMPMTQEVFGKNKSWWKHRRLGNTYKTPALAANWGMVKRLNRALKARSLNGDEAPRPRRYFMTASSFVRCTERDLQCFLMALPGQRCIKGRQEWVAV